MKTFCRKHSQFCAQIVHKTRQSGKDQEEENQMSLSVYTDFVWLLPCTDRQIVTPKTQLTALKTQLTALKKQLTALKKQLTALKKQLTALKKQLTALKKQLTALKKQLTA
ncbi:MAG: hypothetical protein IKH86_05900, partial [Prevotella sp.]|nr:hypothetical protein [Prevotella sp.]